MKYFYSYEKIEIWKKCIIGIKDDADPIKAYKNMDYDIKDSSLLYDTELLISPEDNYCQPTDILEDENNNVIWDNTKDDLSMQ